MALLLLLCLCAPLQLLLGSGGGISDDQQRRLGTQPQPSDDAYTPSWIPGYPGIDWGTRYFTYKIDVSDILTKLVVGKLYQSYVANRRPDVARRARTKPLEHAPHELTVGAFACLDDLPVCLWSCCFAKIRMGDSLQAVEVAAHPCPRSVTAFWAPLCVYAASRVIANLMGLVPGMPKGLPSMSMFVFQACFFAAWRQALREKLGAPSGGSSSWRDLLLWTCCSHCAAAQEAQEVDRATGVRVGYCFSVETLEVVGEPLLVVSNRA